MVAHSRDFLQSVAARRTSPTQVESGPQVDQYVFLLGRPPITEFLGFVRTMALDGPVADQGALTQEWRTANDHLKALEGAEAGIADNATTAPLPPEVEVLAQHVRDDPMFTHAYRLVPTCIAMVELDRLVVFQKFINLGFVESIKSSLPQHLDGEDVARLAFGIDRPEVPFSLMQSGANAFSFISPSNDFRFLEARLVTSPVVDGCRSGRAVAQVVLTVGFGSNYLSAINVRGRLVLNNGSHRAYALRELGLTHVPCIIQQASRPEELDLIVGGDLKDAPERYLEAVRPPVLKDYFDPKLRKAISVPRKNRLVRLQFGCEQSDVPAT